MARSSSTKQNSTKPTTTDRDAIIAMAVQAALAALGETPQAKPKGKGKAAAKPEAKQYDLSKPATRSQVYRAFFAMAKQHHGLSFQRDEWPTSGDVQAILDSIG